MSKGIGWFWAGLGLGLVFSTTAVIVASEFTHIRRARRRTPGFEQGEYDLVEDLSLAVHDGLQVLSRAASEIQSSFDNARREVLRYGIAPQHEGHGGSGQHAWYYGDEEDETQAPV